MNDGSLGIIDSHTHLDILHRHNPEQVEWMKENRYVPVSWSYGGRADSVGALGDYFRGHAALVYGLNNRGFSCFYLAGVHPRCITPDLRPHHIPELLLRYLEDPLCVGIGEIGLETGSPIEEDILSAQLALHDEVAGMVRKFGIHTPRSDKETLTERTLSILSSHPGIETVSVIDHCNLKTLPQVLAKGFHAGITLSPMKTSLDEMETVVGSHRQDLERIMCNTDSGRELFRDLHGLSSSLRFARGARQQLTYDTACCFFMGQPESR